MGFRVNAYATVWNVVDKGNYSEVEMSISKKNTQTDQYETDFASKFVRFIGDAHNNVCNLKRQTRIVLKECDVSNRYDKEQKKEYVNYRVFKFEMAERANTSDSNQKTNPISNDDDLPF